MTKEEDEYEWDENMDGPPANWEPGEEITLELYREWRHPRRGTENPQPINNPVWEWLTRTRVDPFLVAKYFDETDGYGVPPGWCFCRRGRTTTTLPDGRIVMVAGEHEDSYDPDFYIYNDVIIQHPDGRLELFIYPVEDFPPTDFHTATLLGDRIILIGNLGSSTKKAGCRAQVLELDLLTMKVGPLETFGEGPGWIHGHRAELSPDQNSIIIRGGEFLVLEGMAEVDNYDEWELAIETLTWKRLTHVPIERWMFRRKNRSRLLLLNLRRQPEGGEKREMYQQLIDENKPPGFEPDLEALRQLYCPPIPHEREEPSADSWSRDEAQMMINGARVRFRENWKSILLTIEGELESEMVQALVSDVFSKLERFEGFECEAIPCEVSARSSKFPSN